MAPLRGWGPNGQRLAASAPFGHWKTMTFIATLRRRDQCALGHRQPHQWRALHALRREGAGAHPVKGRGRYPRQPRQSQRQGRPQCHSRHGSASFFLPPYSPDLNPIEQVFAKLKHLIRAAAPRDVEATWRKVGELLDLFSPQECANYLKNSGYVSV